MYAVVKSSFGYGWSLFSSVTENEEIIAVYDNPIDAMNKYKELKNGN